MSNYPLEVKNEDENDLHATSDDNVQELNNQALLDNTHNTSSNVRVQRGAAHKALQKMSEWTTVLCRAPKID